MAEVAELQRWVRRRDQELREKVREIGRLERELRDKVEVIRRLEMRIESFTGSAEDVPSYADIIVAAERRGWEAAMAERPELSPGIHPRKRPLTEEQRENLRRGREILHGTKAVKV